MKTSRGDTLIEVMFAIAIFSMVAMVTMNMMNDGLNTAQRTLESEMARNEIDAQAESLRFIHDNYVAEYSNANTDSQYRKIWDEMVKLASPATKVEDNPEADPTTTVFFDINNMTNCSDAYRNNGHLTAFKSFVLNPRLLVPDSSANTHSDYRYLGTKYSELLNKMLVKVSSGKLVEPAINPRIIYGRLDSSDSSKTTDNAVLDEGSSLFNNIVRAEGIWIDAVGNNNLDPKKSDYFDFYIRTCWNAAGQYVSSTITTVVRLYNPEVMR